MRAHHDQVRIARSSFLSNSMKGVTREHDDLCLGGCAKARDLI